MNSQQSSLQKRRLSLLLKSRKSYWGTSTLDENDVVFQKQAEYDSERQFMCKNVFLKGSIWKKPTAAKGKVSPTTQAQGDTYETYLIYLEANGLNVPESCALDCLCWLGLHFLTNAEESNTDIISIEMMERKANVMKVVLDQILQPLYLSTAGKLSLSLHENKLIHASAPTGTAKLPFRQSTYNAIKGSRRITPTEISKLCWCLVALQTHDEFTAVLRYCWVEIVKRIEEFHYKDLHCCFYCAVIAHLGTPGELRLLFSKIIENLQLFNFDETTIMLFALYKLQWEIEPFINKIYSHLERCIPGASTLCLGELVHVVALFGIGGETELKMLSKIIKYCESRISYFNNGNLLIDLVTSINMCGIKAPRFLKLLAQYLSENLQILSPKQCCLLAYAFVVQKSYCYDDCLKVAVQNNASLLHLPLLLPSLLPSLQLHFRPKSPTDAFFSIYCMRHNEASTKNLIATNQTFKADKVNNANIDDSKISFFLAAILEKCYLSRATLDAKDIEFLRLTFQILRFAEDRKSNQVVDKDGKSVMKEDISELLNLAPLFEQQFQRNDFSNFCESDGYGCIDKTSCNANSRRFANVSVADIFHANIFAEESMSETHFKPLPHIPFATIAESNSRRSQNNQSQCYPAGSSLVSLRTDLIPKSSASSSTGFFFFKNILVGLVSSFDLCNVLSVSIRFLLCKFNILFLVILLVFWYFFLL